MKYLWHLEPGSRGKIIERISDKKINATSTLEAKLTTYLHKHRKDLQGVGKVVKMD